MEEAIPVAHGWSARKLTHAEARMEQRLYWSGKSVAERLAAMTELTRRMYRMRGIDLDEFQTDVTARRVLAAAKVEYAVVGGVAVNAHGYVRATNDLDVFIRPTEENARAAFEALSELGVPLGGLQPVDLLDDEIEFLVRP